MIEILHGYLSGVIAEKSNKVVCTIVCRGVADGGQSLRIRHVGIALYSTVGGDVGQGDNRSARIYGILIIECII